VREIILHEISSMVRDLRFFVFAGITSALLLVGAFISSNSYQRAKAHRDTIIRSYEQGLADKCRKYSLEAACFDIGHVAVKRLNPLMFLVDGGWRDYPDMSVVMMNNQKFFGHYSKEYYYPKRSFVSDVRYFQFVRWDMCFIVQVLFSLMVVVLCYNTISREKELGTLRLVLSNSIPRYKVILGKILAAFSVVEIALAFGIVLELLAVLMLGKIPVGISLLPRIAFFFLVSSGYVLLWILISTFVSCSFPKSSTCLVYLLLIWIVFILIVPSLGKG